MAVLSKIRQRSILLIGVIGFCLLAFIVGDIINSGGFGGVSRHVGSVNGTDIPAQDFITKVSDLEKRQQGISATQAANAVWNQEVESILLEERYEKAGIRVGREHVLNIYAQDPQISGNPQFQNALGKFDKKKFNDFLANMKATNPAQYEMVQRSTPQIEEAAKRQIYTSMLKAGFIVTEAEGKAKYKDESDKITFDYVYVPFSTINDDQVKVSDQEMIDYMKKNEKKYKAEASREFEYVLIENKPSAADEEEMRKNINGFLAPRVEYNAEKKANDTIQGFAQVANVEEFVNKNSDIKYDTTYVAKKDLPVEHAEAIYNLAPGQVYGPYVDNGYYKLTRVTGRKAGATVNARHILVAYKGGQIPNPSITRTKEEAKAKADGLLVQAMANPNGFAELARTNTDDPGSANTGGEYLNIVPNQMVKPFNDFVFNNPVGKMGVVETDFGYHVIYVTGKNDGVRVATVAQKIESSEATGDEAFRKATNIEMEGPNKPFADLAKAAGVTVQNGKAGANDENIQGIGNQRQIVKWAFAKDTNVGDVKKFDIPQGHVVVRLKTINEKGLLSIEDAKISVAPIIRNQKKAEMIRKKMTGSTLEAVAQKSGSSVVTATDVTFAAPMIMNVGAEPKVVGKAFGLAAGKTSQLIDGNGGVFMIRTKAKVDAPALPNYATYVQRMKSEARGGVPSRIVMALKEKADIEDNRAEFN
ncbi:MAG: peptidylprolyl isomerase [Flavobacterium sp.]